MTDSELVLRRPLTSGDRSHLRAMFELQLDVTDDASREDANDLIEYALDMVGRGKNVGSVMEEVRYFLRGDHCAHDVSCRLHNARFSSCNCPS